MPAEPAASRPGNASGRKTRQLLIRTAERLFAEQGIDGVSLRQIVAAAGLRMSSAVAYHFGDKDGLIRAILEDRTMREDEHRRPLLDELEREGRTGDLRAVTEAGIRPSVEELGHSGHYYRFLAQLDRHPQANPELQSRDAFKSNRRIVALQQAAAGKHVPATLVEQRRQLVTHLVYAALADLEAGREADEVPIADLIDCVVALYSTPPSRETLEVLSKSAT